MCGIHDLPPEIPKRARHSPGDPPKILIGMDVNYGETREYVT